MPENILHIVLPEPKGIFKFIQLVVRDEPYFRQEEDNENHHAYHYKILEAALKEFGIVPHFQNMDERQIPVELGNEYELVGAGRMFYIPKKNEWVLYGSSEDYGMGPSQQHLNALLDLLGSPSKFRIDYS